MSRPRVAVLLASYDGAAFLDEQLDSILGQEGVDVHVVVSDDGSTDGTLELLEARRRADVRLSLLPALAPSGSSAANFARLLRDADLSDVDLVAMSDQDDVWLPGKLARHAAILAGGDVQGVSSDVTAVSPDGRRRLVRKAFPQRSYDWVCESPGPGSTFLLTPALVDLVRAVLRDHPDRVAAVDYNDWLVYALCRARGWRWHIDDRATVDYRQHAANVMGANLGLRARFGRLLQARDGWHRRQALAVLDAGVVVAPDPEPLRALRGVIADGSRLALARRAPELRRRARDRAALAALVLAGSW